MDSYISGEIKKGDLILAASDNYIAVGFYLGTVNGKIDQYYTINSLWNWSIEGMLGKPRKDYIVKYSNDRIVKYSPELMCDEQKETYEKALEALKLLNI